MENFNNNPFIGPSIADFRRFLLKCTPRPNFKHYILACGTVIRGDYLDTINPININEKYNNSLNEMKKIVKYDQIIYGKLLTILSNIKAELLNASAIYTEQKIWLVSLSANDNILPVSILAPGKTVDDACPYAFGAFRADYTCPVLYAVIEPYESENEILYKIIWNYGRPNTLHWPDDRK